MIFNITGGGGGGTALNFNVVAYETEDKLLAAAAPSENTVGVITDTPMTSWIFSSTEPSPVVAGMVWFSTGVYSLVEFNALKKNGIQVYPRGAKQYVGGAWVDKEAKSFQGGVWVDWWDGELYDKGKKYEDITGGFTGSRFTDTGTSIGATGSYYNAGGGGSIYTNKAIDVTEYNTLCVNVSSFSRENSNTAHFGLTSTRGGDFAVQQEITSQGTKYLDISGLSGEYYFLLRISDTYTSSTVTVYFDLIKLMNR